MNVRVRIALAGTLVAASVGVPWLLQHQAQAAWRARHDASMQRASRLSLLLEENGRLSNQVAQANAASALTTDQLRELMRLRNEKRWLAEQAKSTAPLSAKVPEPAQLSPAELKAALCAELIEAMKRILPALQPALQRYALDHSNQTPESFSDLEEYFPLVAGRKMVGLHEFQFVRENGPWAPGPRPGDALLLRASPGSRQGDGPEVRIYGFSDGRVLEVSSEDGHFEDWEKQHLSAAPPGTEEKVFLEAAGTVEERAHITQLAASVGISAEDARRFFDQFKQEEKTLGPRLDELRKSLTGSPEEQQRQMRAAVEVELNKLAIETLGDKGPALVQKMAEGK
jgi:hypothetical protein